MKTRMTTAATTLIALTLLASDPLSAATLPVVSSATLTFRLDASDINDNGGVTDPGNGNDVNTWQDLVGSTQLIHNAPTDGKPTFIAAGGGGIGNQDTVRFVSDGFGTNAGVGDLQADDLMYDNPASFQARTIIAVTSMNLRTTGVLQTLISNAGAGLNVRQTTTNIASYFTGNSGDFINGAAGTFNINGNPRYDIPGGFGQAHVLKLIRSSTATYSGFRISDNVAADRRWNGDVAEILVYNNVLNGNDIAAVNSYLIEKYGITQVVDEQLSTSSQVATDPFADYAGQINYAVNFHYGGPNVTTKFMGIGFDNVDVASLPTGPFALSANANNAGATLTLGWNGFTIDNTVRTQSAGITGADAATLNGVAAEMFYLAHPSVAGNDHDGVSMLFAGLAANAEVYVQLIGGDNGWTGDIGVTVNGQALGLNWTNVADGVSNNSASLFAFFATTDALGQLDIDLAVVAGNFAGISGIIVSVAVPIPAALPAGLGLLGLVALRRRR